MTAYYNTQYEQIRSKAETPSTYRDKNQKQHYWLWQPVYEKGVAVRFAATNTDIAQNQTTWQQPRVLYLQHASDPVVWFSFDLLINKPDWLAERRGPDVSPATRWYPIVTFLQVGIDQFFGTTVPNGHGHNYANTMVTAWGAIAPPDGWSQAKTEKLQTIIDQY